VEHATWLPWRWCPCARRDKELGISNSEYAWAHHTCRHGNSFVLFTVFQAKFRFEYETKSKILEVFMWSLQCLKDEQFPSTRHDGAPWKENDKARARLKGQLPAKCILCEIGGHWDWRNRWLQFPTYNTGNGMCWLCPAKHADYKAMGPNERMAGLQKAKFVSEIENMEKFCALCGLGQKTFLLSFVYLIGSMLWTKE